MKKLYLALVVALALALGACGSDSETVTVTEEAEAPDAVTVTKDAPKPKPKPQAEQVDQGLGGGDTATVPDVVGQDHQLAQDTMQAAGFYVLDEKDCSGQDRMLLWDRNWTVVEQTPPGGTKTSVDDTITLCSVKDGE
jgi:hypothetical protein